MCRERIRVSSVENYNIGCILFYYTYYIRRRLIESPCLIVLQWQREAGQLVLYRGIRGDDVIGCGTRLTSLGINRLFSYTDPYIFNYI